MQTLRFTIDVTSTKDRFFVEEWVIDCIARNAESNEAFSAHVKDVPLDEEHKMEIMERIAEEG